MGDEMEWGFDPDATLQATPINVGFYGRQSAAPDDARSLAERPLGKHDPHRAPEGKLLGVLMAVGAAWIPGESVKFGPFSATAGPDEEHLLSLVSPSEWLAARSLELRVHRQTGAVADPFLPKGSDEVVFRAVASRKARWSPRAEPLPKDAFVDHQRGLRLRIDGGDLVMDWFHKTRDDVFCELRKSATFMRAVMVRGAGPIGPDGPWYEAPETRFPL